MNLEPLLSTLKIRTKNQQLISLNPNWAQRELLDVVYRQHAAKKPIRIIVLKARRLGISTLAEAIAYLWIVLHENTNSAVVAHEREATESLFEMTKLYHETFPFSDLFPLRYQSRRHMQFADTGSNLWVMTADNWNAARSRTIHMLHASEVAFWKDPTETMIALRQTIPELPGTCVILESTANGIGNWWEQQWVAAKQGQTDYIPMFFPWWREPTSIPCQGYRCTNGSCGQCKEGAAGVKKLDVAEGILAKMGVDRPHLAWRRWAIANLCFGSVDLFMQEYPATDDEAFLVSGVRAFPEIHLRACFEPKKPGLGRLVRDDAVVGGVRFISDQSGPLRIYQMPSADQNWGQYFIGADSCQPPGTMVRRVYGSNKDGRRGPGQYEEVPIEQIQVGDRVVTLNMQQPGSSIRRVGRKVTAAGVRDYDDPLVVIQTPNGRTSRYTTDHRCVVRLDGDLDEGNHLVYLAQRGNRFRIGRSKWRNQSGASGFRHRAASQAADAMWILSVHQTEEEAALNEAVLSTQFGLPLWQFHAAGQKEAMPLARFWDKIGANLDRADACLDAIGLDIRFPFWSRDEGWQRRADACVVRAINLRSGMMVLEPDEIPPGPRGYLKVRRGCGGWTSARVTREWYAGPVYSLDVDEDHTYIADGIVTHNCYGVVDGDNAAAQVINRHTLEQVAVWHGKMNPIAFADELAKLGAFYNQAMIAPETEGPGQGTIGRLVSIYPRIWKMKTADRLPGENESASLGWSTNWKRKMWLVAKLAELIERQRLIIHDPATFQEARGYTFLGANNGFEPAGSDQHDDLVMSLGIAVLCSMTESPPTPYELRPKSNATGLIFGDQIRSDDDEGAMEA